MELLKGSSYIVVLICNCAGIIGIAANVHATLLTGGMEPRLSGGKDIIGDKHIGVVFQDRLASFIYILAQKIVGNCIPNTFILTVAYRDTINF